MATMKQHKTKKLGLQTETIRNLDKLELKRAGGGIIITTDVYCPTHYYTCRPKTPGCPQ